MRAADLSCQQRQRAHQPTDDLSVERAKDYLTLADAILYPLRNKPRR